MSRDKSTQMINRIKSLSNNKLSKKNKANLYNNKFIKYKIIKCIKLKGIYIFSKIDAIKAIIVHMLMKRVNLRHLYVINW